MKVNEMNYNYDIEVVDQKNIEVISDEVLQLRFLMKIPLKNNTKNKIGLFIMKNPSNANKQQSDKTLNNIIHFSREMYSTIYIANLYPFVNSNPKNTKDFRNSESFNNAIIKNDQYIKAVIEGIIKSDIEIVDIICAWGSHEENQQGKECFANRVNRVLDLINEANIIPKAMRFKSSINPWHPRNWEKNFELELYSWDA